MNQARRRAVSSDKYGTFAYMMKPTVMAVLLVFAAVSVAEEPVDSDRDGMPDEWEKKYGFNPADPADGAGDQDGDGYGNLEEYKAQTAPVGPTVCHFPHLLFDKVVERGTNRWIHFRQRGGKSVWVREGRPAGPVGGMPDWRNRLFWRSVSDVAVDDSVATNIQVVVTQTPSVGRTNTWVVPYIGTPPPRIEKRKAREQQGGRISSEGALSAPPNESSP